MLIPCISAPVLTCLIGNRAHFFSFSFFCLSAYCPLDHRNSTQTWSLTPPLLHYSLALPFHHHTHFTLLTTLHFRVCCIHSRVIQPHSPSSLPHHKTCSEFCSMFHITNSLPLVPNLQSRAEVGLETCSDLSNSITGTWPCSRGAFPGPCSARETLTSKPRSER